MVRRLRTRPDGGAERRSRTGVATDEDSLFRLEFELPKATYAQVSQSMASHAFVTADRARSKSPGAAGGLIGFSLVDVDGPRDVGGASGRRLRAVQGAIPSNPITTALAKSGGWPQDAADDVTTATILATRRNDLPLGTSY